MDLVCIIVAGAGRAGRYALVNLVCSKITMSKFGRRLLMLCKRTTNKDKNIGSANVLKNVLKVEEMPGYP